MGPVDVSGRLERLKETEEAEDRKTEGIYTGLEGQPGR